MNIKIGYKYQHLIYRYDVSCMMDDSNIQCERLSKDNIKSVDMGYFKLSMVKRMIVNNKANVDGIVFRKNRKSSPVGFAIVLYRGATGIHYKVKECDAYIEMICVDPAFRRQGISQLMLAKKY